MNNGFKADDLHLRAFTPDDVPALAAYLNHPDLLGRRYIPWDFPDDLPLSGKQVEGICEKWLEKEHGVALAIVHNEDEALIGHVDCSWGWDTHSPHLSIVIAPDHQRSGRGSQTLDLILNHLFLNTPAHNVSSYVADWNRAGREFAAAHGFKEGGAMRRAGMRAGDFYDMLLVDMLRPEWDAQKEGGGRGA